MSDVIKVTKSDNKGAFFLKIKKAGRYTIRAEFTDDVFVEQQIEILKERTEIVINLVVK